jgi:hypothetical protein
MDEIKGGELVAGNGASELKDERGSGEPLMLCGCKEAMSPIAACGQ